VNARRLIAVMTLITFLPATTACSGSRTILIDDDPHESETAARFESGEAVEINGYTRPADGFRPWRGFVSVIPPDSLSFESQPPEGIPVTSFRLARTDVVSFDAREFSAANTTAFAVGAVLAAGLIAAGIFGLMMANDPFFNE
jgi:hypothetical protein